MSSSPTKETVNPSYFRAERLLPIIIRGALRQNIPLGSEAEYTMHTLLSDFDPDMAILCTVNIVREVCAYEELKNNDFSFLGNLCNLLADKYRPICTLIETNPRLRENKIQNILPQMAEDLDDLIERLELSHIALETQDSAAAEILQILLVQMQSHLMVVEQLLKERNQSITGEKKNCLLDTIAGLSAKESNIIHFPIKV